MEDLRKLLKKIKRSRHLKRAFWKRVEKARREKAEWKRKALEVYGKADAESRKA